MVFYFALYIVAIFAVIFVGFMACRDNLRNKKYDNVDRIADLQRWEYLRSFNKDGFKDQ